MSDTKSFFAELNTLSFKDAARIATIVAQAGEEWYEADALASAQEENKKSYLAKLVLEYLEGGLPGAKPDAKKAMPISQAEIRAQADPRFEEYNKNMVELRKRANLARVKYDMGKMFIEMQRSVQATQRQEMQMTKTY